MNGTKGIVVGAMFAAACILLTVRIVNRRERCAKWAAVSLACLPILYVLSFGPACWITSRCMINGDWISRGYAPIIWAWNNCDDPVWDFFSYYAGLGASPDWVWEADERGWFTNFVPRSYDP